MSSYTSQWPKDMPQDRALIKFYEDFYRISDTPDAHEEYADQFTEDATLVMVSKEAKGRDEILALRKGMWQKVTARTHNPIAIFPAGPHTTDLMLHGTVEYTFKEGGSGDAPWAARAELVKTEQGYKMSFYQVYLDSARQVPRS